jgi:TRAP-type C4-dicarboxylate transport system permease small subunit
MLEKLLNSLKQITDIALILVTTFIISLISINIARRLMGFSSVFWANEVVRLGFIWICGLGIISAIFGNDHMKLEIFRISSKLQSLLRKISWILFCIFFIFLASSGMMVVKTHIEMGRTLKTLPDIPFWIFSIFLPICFIISVAVAFIFLLKEK